ncbi:MAG: HD domain-containing protein [Candidatus Paceibacterota bacterium]|jgi:putative hydrolase of HD superfamily|nr:HD domain-containing protein [Candidatus Paceibacterota bacterium]
MKDFIHFIFELGHLRFVPRSGWSYLRIPDPENDAEHSARVAQIAFVLAVLEKHEDPCRVATIGLFHEIAEIRTNDPNTIAKQYVTSDEDSAVKNQTASIGEAGSKILEMWRECEEHATDAGKIAKDADRLEMMFTAKEYMETGYSDAGDWIISSMALLETDSAKQLAEELKETGSNDWWRKIQYNQFKI